MVQLEKAMTFRVANDETRETRTLAILPLELLVFMEYCVCTWCLEAHLFCCRKNCLRDLGCSIDLGRGHLSFEKLGVRAEVTSEQPSHLLLPLTSFGPQGHKIPASALTNVQSTVPHVTVRV